MVVMMSTTNNETITFSEEQARELVAAAYANTPFIGVADYRFDSTKLCNALETIALAVSEDETRPVLTAVKVSLSGEYLELVAADSYTLMQMLVEYEHYGPYDLSKATAKVLAAQDLLMRFNSKDVQGLLRYLKAAAKDYKRQHGKFSNYDSCFLHLTCREGRELDAGEAALLEYLSSVSSRTIYTQRGTGGGSSAYYGYGRNNYVSHEPEWYADKAEYEWANALILSLHLLKASYFQISFGAADGPVYPMVMIEGRYPNFAAVIFSQQPQAHPVIHVGYPALDVADLQVKLQETALRFIPTPKDVPQAKERKRLMAFLPFGLDFSNSRGLSFTRVTNAKAAQPDVKISLSDVIPVPNLGSPGRASGGDDFEVGVDAPGSFRYYPNPNDKKHYLLLCEPKEVAADIASLESRPALKEVVFGCSINWTFLARFVELIAKHGHVSLGAFTKIQANYDLAKTPLKANGEWDYAANPDGHYWEGYSHPVLFTTSPTALSKVGYTLLYTLMPMHLAADKSQLETTSKPQPTKVERAYALKQLDALSDPRLSKAARFTTSATNTIKKAKSKGGKKEATHDNI